MEVFMCDCCKRIVEKEENGVDSPQCKRLIIDGRGSPWILAVCGTCRQKVWDFVRSLLVPIPPEHNSHVPDQA
jgi:hypothetical protein